MYLSFANDVPNEIKEIGYSLASDGGRKILEIGPISDVNIFVGANNSGKSKFLRGLLNNELQFSGIQSTYNKIINDFVQWLDEYQVTLESIEDFNIASANPLTFVYQSLYKKEYAYKTGISSISKSYLINVLAELAKQLDKDPFAVYNLERIKELQLYLDLMTVSDKNRLAKYFPSDSSYFIRQLKPSTWRKLAEIKSQMEQIFSLVNKNKLSKTQNKNIYIPILRTNLSLLIGNQKHGGSILKSTASNLYTLKYQRLEIFTGEETFNYIRRQRNSRRGRRKDFENFEKYLSRVFFDNKEVELVAEIKDDANKEHITIFIDNDDRELHEVGDGIQAIILLMLPIFTAEENTWIFIEEPEINLHPGLQRVFLEELINNEDIKKKNLKIFFTTHSNHLLDIAIGKENVSIFAFEKLAPQNHIIRQIKGPDIDILDQLGVTNSSVFMANCSIWVEGVTDRKYFRAYLEAYIKEHSKPTLLEDLHYSFFEYAGSNVSHYFFSQETTDNDTKAKINALALSNRILLLADSDENKDKKHNVLTEAAKENKQFDYIRLPVS